MLATNYAIPPVVRYEYTVAFYKDGAWGATEKTRFVKIALRRMEMVKEQFDKGEVEALKLVRRDTQSENQEWELLMTMS